MDSAEFERLLVADGFVGQMVDRVPGESLDDHTHDWDVRALVTAGEFTISVDNIPTTYRTGEIFALSAGCVHREVVGDTGVTYLAGRRAK
jgi:quercetin dioxygenase-like cupin family protein